MDWFSCNADSHRLTVTSAYLTRAISKIPHDVLDTSKRARAISLVNAISDKHEGQSASQLTGLAGRMQARRAKMVAYLKLYALLAPSVGKWTYRVGVCTRCPGLMGLWG